MKEETIHYCLLTSYTQRYMFARLSLLKLPVFPTRIRPNILVIISILYFRGCPLFLFTLHFLPFYSLSIYFVFKFQSQTLTRRNQNATDWCYKELRYYCFIESLINTVLVKINFLTPKKLEFIINTVNIGLANFRTAAIRSLSH